MFPLFFVFFISISSSIAQNSIKFYTDGQQYGVADLDHFWISATKDKNNCCFEQRMEHPDENTVGHEAGRTNAKDGFVWDQFGCGSTDPYPSKSGYVRYNNVTCEGKQYIKIAYSKHSPSNVPIEILVNDKKQAEFIPVDQGNWESFTETDWIEINFPQVAFEPPEGVSATDGTYTDKVRITWNSSTGASHYRVYRNTSSSASGATALGSWQTSIFYDDISATPGRTYYYWIKAAESSTGSNASDFSSYDTGYIKSPSSLLIPEEIEKIEKFTLNDNYPNPFNSSTEIRFYVPISSRINLSIYNLTGNLIKKILDFNLPKGVHQITWDGTDNNGNYISSGLYIYRLSTANISLQKKLLFIK